MTNKITDLGSITSGWIPDKGDGIFFVKIGDNRWLSTKIPDVYSKSSIEKLKFVSDKAAVININKHYIEILASEFGTSLTEVTNSEVIGYQSLRGTGTVSESVKPEGDYVVDGSAVIVNGQKYTVGSNVYHGGVKFIVRMDGDDVYLSHPGGGSLSDTPIVGSEEIVIMMDYTNATTLITPTYSGVNAKFIDTINSSDPDKVFISEKGAISRVLRASKSSTLRYWECFRFHSGIVATDKVQTEVTGPWSGVNKLTS